MTSATHLLQLFLHLNLRKWSKSDFFTLRKGSGKNTFEKIHFFNFYSLDANISKTVRDRAILSMDHLLVNMFCLKIFHGKFRNDWTKGKKVVLLLSDWAAFPILPNRINFLNFLTSNTNISKTVRDRAILSMGHL